jgi:hypothetical protein
MSGHGNIPTMLRANRRRYLEAEAAQMARLEAKLALEDDGGPPPVDRNTCMVCGGACPLGVVGHSSCTGRRAA